MFLFWSLKSLTCTRGFPWQMAAKMVAAQEYYFLVPRRGGHLSCHFFRISHCTSCWKKLLSGDFIRKNRELCVNLTILVGFFAITRLKFIERTNDEQKWIENDWSFWDLNCVWWIQFVLKYRIVTKLLKPKCIVIMFYVPFLSFSVLPPWNIGNILFSI